MRGVPFIARLREPVIEKFDQVLATVSCNLTRDGPCSTPT